MFMFIFLFYFKLGLTQTPPMIFIVHILPMKLLLFFIILLPALIMNYKLGQHLSHKLIMMSHKLLLFQLLPYIFGMSLVVLLFVNVLKYSLHLFVVLWEWEFGKWHNF